MNNNYLISIKNRKYEKLHEKAEKSKDKSLTKEVEKLETELTAKEEEINAVVSLYKEVCLESLKFQDLINLFLFFIFF